MVVCLCSACGEAADLLYVPQSWQPELGAVILNQPVVLPDSLGFVSAAMHSAKTNSYSHNCSLAFRNKLSFCYCAHTKSTGRYLCSLCVLLLQLSPQDADSLVQQGGEPESEALPVGLRLELFPQFAVETQNVPVALLVLPVTLLYLFPQQGQLALDTFEALQVDTGDCSGRKDWLGRRTKERTSRIKV